MAVQVRSSLASDQYPSEKSIGATSTGVDGLKKSTHVDDRDSYKSDGVKDNDIFNLPGSDWQLLGLITVLAFAVRLYKLWQPSSVVFDEVHFGGFASKYIKGKFFMDVHPPLAKLLITLAGWLAGFDGNFDFKDIGKDYLEPGVPYVAMRALPAVLGVLVIPTIFLTLKAHGCRTTTAALGAGLVMFENGLLTQSRLILLDSPLVIFTAMTALCWTCFTNQHEQGPARAFSPNWWFWLAATGVCLGATASVKWVGLFTIAWIGSLTLVQLWVLLGDTKTVTPRLFFKHFSARALCLIVIPIAFYMSMFAIHFVCLVNPGEGDGFMSSEFQSTLNSKGMNDVAADVAFGSRISLRHHNTQGGYLHSHNHMYPTGSHQQQITLYPHKDENNVWIIENQTLPEMDPKPTGLEIPKVWDARDPVFIKNGDVLKLYHANTHRRLHSHDHKPPVTEADWQKEVTAYGYEGFEGDANDFFRVEIVKSMSDGPKAQEYLRTIETKFRLVHIMSGCVLFSHKVKLPDWGFEQQEVTCATGATLPNSIWYIESNVHPKLGDEAEKVNYKRPGFFAKFWELQQVMWRTNAGLVESHAWDSRPPSWPIMRRGINFWGKENRQIYLIGNPIVWYTSTAAILAYATFKGLAILRWQRGFQDYAFVNIKRFDYEVGTSVLGWALHYFPFYLMARQLFLHHYFPALYFAIIAACQVFDFVFSRFQGLGLMQRPVAGRTVAALYLALSIVAFITLSPLSYGLPWTKTDCNRVKVFSTWDFDCNTFHDSYAQYNVTQATVDSKIPSSSAPLIANEEKISAALSQPAVPAQQVQDAGKEGVPAGGAANQQVGGQDQPGGAAGKPPVQKELKVEYRDEKGRIIPDEQAEALKGKVKFSTRYETRTRRVDANGNVEYEGIVGTAQPIVEQPPAPPHPDVEGANPETKAQNDPAKQQQQAGQGQQPLQQQAEEPAPVEASTDPEKEKLVEQREKMAKPASEGNEATETA